MQIRTSCHSNGKSCLPIGILARRVLTRRHYHGTSHHSHGTARHSNGKSRHHHRTARLPIGILARRVLTRRHNHRTSCHSNGTACHHHRTSCHHIQWADAHCCIAQFHINCSIYKVHQHLDIYLSISQYGGLKPAVITAFWISVDYFGVSVSASLFSASLSSAFLPSLLKCFAIDATITLCFPSELSIFAYL